MVAAGPAMRRGPAASEYLQISCARRWVLRFNCPRRQPRRRHGRPRSHSGATRIEAQDADHLPRGVRQQVVEHRPGRAGGRRRRDAGGARTWRGGSIETVSRISLDGDHGRCGPELTSAATSEGFGQDLERVPVPTTPGKTSWSAIEAFKKNFLVADDCAKNSRVEARRERPSR